MYRLNVRCCCQPQKILGTIELRSLERNQWLTVATSYRAGLYGGDIPIAVPTVETHQIKVRQYKEPGTIDLEEAVYSDDRPIEFWRQFASFQEAPVFDMKQYLTDKAEKAGLTLREDNTCVKTDARNFLLAGPRVSCSPQPISISGQEEVDHDEKALKMLLDSRFANAVYVLDRRMR